MGFLICQCVPENVRHQIVRASFLSSFFDASYFGWDPDTICWMIAGVCYTNKKVDMCNFFQIVRKSFLSVLKLPCYLYCSFTETRQGCNQPQLRIAQLNNAEYKMTK